MWPWLGQDIEASLRLSPSPGEQASHSRVTLGTHTTSLGCTFSTECATVEMEGVPPPRPPGLGTRGSQQLLPSRGVSGGCLEQLSCEVSCLFTGGDMT